MAQSGCQVRGGRGVIYIGRFHASGSMQLIQDKHAMNNFPVGLDEAQAYNLIVERHQAELIRYLYLLLKDSEAALDVAQETFMRGYKLWLELPDRSGWRPLLYKIATNHALNVLRQHRRVAFARKKEVGRQAGPAWGLEPDSESEHSEMAALSADPARQVEVRLAVQSTLRGLSPEAATCLLLHYDQGFSCAEIAGINGASVEAIWQRLSRARRQFCELYRKEQ